MELSLAGRDDGSVAQIHAHELRHFDDLVGNVWGQDYLDLLFRAYDAMLHRPSPELAYPELLRLFDADRAILFPSYYKYVMPGAPVGSAADRWSMAFSTGTRIRPDGAAVLRIQAVFPAPALFRLSDNIPGAVTSTDAYRPSFPQSVQAAPHLGVDVRAPSCGA